MIMTSTLRRGAIAASLLLAPPLAAQAAQPVTLEQALDAGYQQGSHAVLARLDARLATTTAAADRALLYPTLTGDASVDRQTMNLDEFGFPGVSGITDPFTVVRARATVRQVLFDRSAWAGLAAARDSLLAAGADADRIGELTAIDAGVAWLRLAGAEERVRARLADSVTAAELLAIAAQQVAAGTAAQIEEARSRTRAAVNRAALNEARHDVARARIDLARAMNLLPDAPLESAGEAELSLRLPVVGDSAVVIARQHRRDRHAAELRLNVAEQRVRAASLSWWPRLVASGFVQQSGPRADALNGSWNLALGLSWTPFDGFRRQRDIEADRIRVDLARTRLADLDATIAAQARRAAIDLTSARDQVAIATERLALASEELHEAEERLAAGVAGSVETTTAQAGVAEARDALIQAHMSLGAAQLAAAGALGLFDTLSSAPASTGEMSQ